jgi:hypothetical protein
VQLGGDESSIGDVMIAGAIPNTITQLLLEVPEHACSLVNVVDEVGG